MMTHPYRFAVAPMIDWTDRHCRYFHRLLSPHALLYTEMITTGAILHGDRQRFLAFSEKEHPVALQLGGSDPRALAECAVIGQDYGYDEINLNVGCPSDRVQSGRFGACLMAEPQLVAECVATMQSVVSIPVTVKTRLGIDQREDYDFIYQFIHAVAQAGCQHFIIHARNAWLKGLSPKENRTIPPLRYDDVYQLKRDFPHCHFLINGGIKTLMDIDQHLQHVDGVMLGREAYQNPYCLANIDHHLYGTPRPTQQQTIAALMPYLEQQYQATGRIEHVTRHILGLWHGLNGARVIRQTLSDHRLTSKQKLQCLQNYALSGNDRIDVLCGE